MTEFVPELRLSTSKRIGIQVVVSFLLLGFTANLLLKTEGAVDSLKPEVATKPRGDIPDWFFFLVPVVSLIPAVYLYLLLKRDFRFM